MGVNTRIELAKLERLFQHYQAESIMNSGVSIADPSRFDVRGNLIAGKDSFIDIDVLIEGNVSIGENCYIGAHCILKNCTIEDNVNIKSHTVIEGSIIKESAILGPFARVRPGSVIEHNAVIGNFVELKNSTIGAHSKIGHLSYAGDTKIGHHCNIGAGVITCNYDGINKHETVIGNHVFVGSDTQLIAPITLEDYVTIGAGSTITKNITTTQLALSRAKLTVINHWKRPKKLNNQGK